MFKNNLLNQNTYDIMFIYDYSQRRKQKEAEIVGVASGVNSLTTPRHLSNDGYGEEIQGEKERPSSSFTTQSSVLSRPRSTRRKSLAAEKPPVVPEGKKPQRTSLAPAHKQSSKMDLAKATSIMGFTSSRWADASQVTIAFVNYDEMRIHSIFNDSVRRQELQNEMFSFSDR